MLTDTILSGLASDLGDDEPGHEFSRVSRDQLLTYLNEGLCLIGSLNPGLRSKPTILELDEGSEQTLGCCGRLSNVIGQVDENGNVIARLSKSSLTAVVRWTKAPCLSSNASGPTFRLKSYTNSAADSRFFTVDPPVPPGTRVLLKVICSRNDGTYQVGDELDETDCANITAAKFWVLFRAHFIDNESSPEYQKAMAAAKMFFQLINVKYRADMLYEMGVLPVNKSTNFLDASAQ